MIGECLEQYFGDGHLCHGQFHSLVLSLGHSVVGISGNKGFQITKKGLEGPLGRAPPRLAGGLSTPGGALRYEDQRCCSKSTHGCALRSEAVFYMHCGSAGQVNCGGNTPRRGAAAL